MNNSFFNNNDFMCSNCNLKAKINLEKCKRCYKCVSRCPQNAIIMGEKGYPKVDITKCNGCQLCKKPCIDFYYENTNEKITNTDNKSKENLIKTVDEFLIKHNLISQNTTLLVGFSGGFDSCALLHILYTLRKKYKFKLCATHLNHGWRGEESDIEEKNCNDFCSKYGIDFYSEKLNKDVAQTETAAREARYEFFIRSAKHFNTTNILTAHNKTDNAETLLYRIAKGTGIKGLCGIEEKRKLNGINIFRPILSIQRNEIEEYCKINDLAPNNDSSNFNTKYKRNFIRHEVLPLLEKINPNAKNAIDTLRENAKDSESIINEYLSSIKEQIFNENKVKTNKFSKLSQALKQRIIYDLIIEKGLDYDRKKIFEIINFIDTSAEYKSGKTLSLTNNLWLFCSKKEFYFINTTSKTNNNVIDINDFEKEYIFDNFKFTIKEYSSKANLKYPKENELFAYIDLNKQKNLQLRYRKAGDKIQPFGMKNVIKLKDFFINKAIPKHQRDEIVLLCNHEEVLWACTVGLSEKLRVQNTPTHIIRIDEV